MDYRHTGRKLSPDELIELLDDQHEAMANDEIMRHLDATLKHAADALQLAMIRMDCQRAEVKARLSKPHKAWEVPARCQDAECCYYGQACAGSCACAEVTA